MPICPVCVVTVCVCFCGYQKLVHRSTQGWGWLTLNWWPALNTKTSHLFPVLSLPATHWWLSGNIKNTTPTPPFLSVCHAKASLLPFLSPSSVLFLYCRETSSLWFGMQFHGSMGSVWNEIWESEHERERQRTSSRLASWWIKDGGTMVL